MDYIYPKHLYEVDQVINFDNSPVVSITLYSYKYPLTHTHTYLSTPEPNPPCSTSFKQASPPACPPSPAYTQASTPNPPSWTPPSTASKPSCRRTGSLQAKHALPARGKTATSKPPSAASAPGPGAILQGLPRERFVIQDKFFVVPQMKDILHLTDAPVKKLE